MISSELLIDLLTPDGEGALAPSAQARLQAFFELLPLALMEFRLEGVRLVLVAANAAARRMPGLGAVCGPGTDALDVFDLMQGMGIVEQLCAVARAGVPLESRPVVREPGRPVLAWELSARSVASVASNSIMVTVRDVSEAEALRAALAASERALEEARRELHEQSDVFNTMESLARTGHWRQIEDPGETVLLWSPGLCDIAGFERQEWLSRERAVSGILPEDRHVFEEAREKGEGADIEYRWRRPDGEVRWMRSRVRHGRAGDGMPVEMGVVQDVTDERRAAEQLREQLLFIGASPAAFRGSSMNTGCILMAPAACNTSAMPCAISWVSTPRMSPATSRC